MKRDSEIDSTGRAFTSLPLHDAILNALRVEWKERRCIMDLDVFVNLGSGEDAVPRLLVWDGVTDLVLPHHDPWGPSVFVNGASFERPSTYVIEMQSGDEIRIIAKHCELVTPQA